MSCKDCCITVCDNLSFCSAQVKEKFKDDLLIGTEHSKKIIPTCQTPQNSMDELTQDEKVQIVLNDPKFGMFALFKWHIKKGHKNEILKEKMPFIAPIHSLFLLFYQYLYLSHNGLFILPSSVMKLNNMTKDYVQMILYGKKKLLCLPLV